MSPRAYRMTQRLGATEQTRSRILEAARDLLMSGEGAGRFTIEAIARQAGVARMTVYYQFGSKRGLLEALFDSLAARGLMDRMPAVFTRSEPMDALAGLIDAFCAFWDSDRLVIRRVRALSLLDPEVGESIQARDNLRRHHLQGLVARLARRYSSLAAANVDETVDLLTTLTSFETYDSLAGEKRNWQEVSHLIYRSAGAALGLEIPANQ